MCLLFFFFNDTATTDIYTLSLHDALPIYKFHGLTLANFRDEGLVPGFRMRTSNHRTPDSRIPVEAVRETTPIGSQCVESPAPCEIRSCQFDKPISGQLSDGSARMGETQATRLRDLPGRFRPVQ